MSSRSTASTSTGASSSSTPRSASTACPRDGARIVNRLLAARFDSRPPAGRGGASAIAAAGGRSTIDQLASRRRSEGEGMLGRLTKDEYWSAVCRLTCLFVIRQGGECIGNRNRQVVQRRQGVRLHHARWRRQRPLRPPQRRRRRGLQEPR